MTKINVKITTTKDNDDEDGADTELVPEALGGAVDINWSPPINHWSRH